MVFLYQNPLTLALVFIFGAIVGSFLNVVSLRMRTGRTLYGRSSCPSCGRILRAWELVPILSFFIINGRCSSCKSKISWQYPTVEFFTGLLFVFSTVKVGNYDFTIPFFVFGLTALFCSTSALVVIFVYDLKHKIIPDTLVLILFISALLWRVIVYTSGQLNSLLDFLSPLIFFSFFALIWLISSGRAMGFGDAKLALALGLLLGFYQSLTGFVFAFWIGAAVSVAILLLQKLLSKGELFHVGKTFTIKSEIPFAPFIIIGCLLAFLFNIDLLHAILF